MAADRSRYQVHRFPIRMTQDERRLERFLDGLDGEVVAIVPNVAVRLFWFHEVDFLYIVERLAG